MPKLLPITAVTYNTRNSKDLSARIAPPYDVLDQGPKQRLLERDPNNIVAIDLPVTPPKTVGPDEMYIQAGEQYRDWLSRNILQADSRPAIYAYEQLYRVEGQQLARRGLIAALGLEPYNRADGGIFRHELTIASGVNDRYKLMESAQAQFSPIFGIFSDPEGEVVAKLSAAFDNHEPDFFGTTQSDGVTHRVWRIDDDALISALQYFFVMTDVFIADGHHRYTTAMKFHEDHPELEKADGCLFVLVAAEDPGMMVLPTHRVLLGLQGLTLHKLQGICNQDNAIELQRTAYRSTESKELAADLSNHEHHAMGLYIPGQDYLYRLRYEGTDPLSANLSNKPEVWRRLDVAILHHHFVEQILEPAFTDPSHGQSFSYEYTADLDQLKTMTETQNHTGDRLGVILQPTPLGSVMAVSKANEVMPAKSTYFYPKLATGLVLNPLT